MPKYNFNYWYLDNFIVRDRLVTLRIKEKRRTTADEEARTCDDSKFNTRVSIACATVCLYSKVSCIMVTSTKAVAGLLEKQIYFFLKENNYEQSRIRF
jgi:hypothetical protein